MTKVYVNFEDNAFGWPGNPWDYNTFHGAGTYDTIGVLKADLLDDTGATTGWGLEVTDVFGSAGGSGVTANVGAGGWPEEVFDISWLTENGGTGALKITGLPASQSYTIELSGHNPSTGRHTQFTVEGTSTDYTSSADPDNVTAPVVFSGTVPGDGIIEISATKAATGAFYGYINGLTIEVTASGLTLDSTPTDVNSQTQESSVVSTPATAPTTLNTEIKWDNDLGPAATVDSVSGSDPYTLNYTFPRTTAKLFNATGYPLYHEVDAENVTSGNVPYLPIAGQDFIDLSSPVNTAGTLGETYAGSPAATGDQWVFDTTLTGDATITLDVDAQGYWILSGTPSVTSTASFYRIDSTGTVDVEDTITFQVGGVSQTPSTTIYVNMSNTGTDLPDIPAPWSYNNYIAAKGTSVQQITADLKDSNNQSTNLTLDTVNIFTGAVGSAGNATAGVDDWPLEVFRYGWYAGATESPSKLRVGGLVDGDTFRIEIAGHQGTQATRDTTFDVGTQSGTYDNSGTSIPNAPLVLEGTVSGTTLDIDSTLVDSFAYLSGFKLEINKVAVPPANRRSVFKIAAALRAAETYTHTQTNEIVVEWLESEGISRTTLNQMLYGYLGGLGYSGTLQDRMIKWSRDT